MPIHRPIISPIYRPVYPPIVGGHGLPWEGPGGGGVAPGLWLGSGGAFTRSTEASYLTAAPTDGLIAFLAWAGVNVRRIEDRGDGLGPMLLVEGSRQNLLLRNQEFDNASWTKGAGCTVTADQSAAPDGTVVADRVQSSSGNSGATQNAVILNGSTYAITAYQRAVSGTPSAQLAVAQAAVTASVLALAPTWARAELIRLSTATSIAVLLADARDWSGFGGIVAGNRDGYLWAPQLELQFPSSVIRTAGTAVTRGDDVLTYAVGQFPSSFLTRGFRLRFAPDALPAEAPVQTVLGGLDSGSNNALLLSYDVPGTPKLFVANAAKKTGAFTWATRGQLITVDVQPSLGLITVSGATTGNGTTSVGAWTLDGAQGIRVGNRIDGAVPFFGRIGLTIEAL